MQVQTKKGNLFIILMLGLLTTVSPFSIDLYLPAFQKIADHFSTTPSQVALSLSSYFIGLAVGQILYGPLLDRFGRKRPMYIGLLLYIIASLACMYSQTVNGLIVARFFQALGGCAAAVGSTAMVADFFSPEEGAKVFSQLMLVLSVSPLFAPTVGGWIVSFWGWQAIFSALIIIVTLILLMTFFFLPEGHEPDPTVSLSIKSIFKTFREILRDNIFFAYTFAGAFSLAGLFAYVAGAPSIFFTTYHLTPNMFGATFAFLSLGVIGGGQINILLMKKYSSEKIFKAALYTQGLVAFIFAVLAARGMLNLYGHIAIFFCYLSCVGLTLPNGSAIALSRFPQNAGSAAALLGTIEMVIGSVFSGVFGILKWDVSFSVASCFLATSILGVLVYFWKTKTSLSSVKTSP